MNLCETPSAHPLREFTAPEQPVPALFGDLGNLSSCFILVNVSLLCIQHWSFVNNVAGDGLNASKNALKKALNKLVLLGKIYSNLIQLSI